MISIDGYHCTYTLIIIKKFHNYIKKNFSSHKYEKNIFVLINIRMIHLSLNELKLIAQYRNRSDYENKSKVDLIKALGELKTKIRINY